MKNEWREAEDTQPPADTRARDIRVDTDSWRTNTDTPVRDPHLRDTPTKPGTGHEVATDTKLGKNQADHTPPDLSARDMTTTTSSRAAHETGESGMRRVGDVLASATDLVGIGKSWALSGAVALEVLSGSHTGIRPADMQTDVPSQSSYSRSVENMPSSEGVVNVLAAEEQRASDTGKEDQENWALTEEISRKREVDRLTRDIKQ